MFNLSEVEFALLEVDGEISVLKKSPYNTATPKDLNISTPYKGLILNLIINGRVVETNLKLAVYYYSISLFQRIQLQFLMNQLC